MDQLWTHLSRIGDMLVVVVPLMLWAAKWLKRLELAVSFSDDVATEHLPHIYWRLRRSDDKINLPSVEHPNINYRVINGVRYAPRDWDSAKSGD